jgi:hypothetical protein
MAIDPKININENQVIFKRDIGHRHDGLTSNLIDYTKYSIFDFITYPVASPGTSRRAFEENNVISLKTFIVSAVEERVLNPRGIRVQANAITANEIAAGTITANELSSNIILVNNIIKSNGFQSGSVGWAIYSNGNAEFSNVTMRGTVISNSGTIGGWTLGADKIYAGQAPTLNANYTALYSNGIMNLHSYIPAGFATPSYYYDILIDSDGMTVSSNIGGTVTNTQITSTSVDSPGLSISGEGSIDQLLVTTSAGIGNDTNQSSGGTGASGGWLSSSGFATFTRPGGCLVLNQTTSGSDPVLIAEFRRRGSVVGDIKVTGGGTSYNSGSDYRLKTNIKIISNIEEILNKLKPVEFNWVSDPDQWSHGFIAHELQEIIPYAVSGDKDAINEDGYPQYQQVDYSKLTPILTAGIKMLMEKIEVLEARLQALEGV